MTVVLKSNWLPTLLVLATLTAVYGRAWAQERAEPLGIAVVRDGQSEFFDAIVAGLERELTGLAAGKYEFAIIDSFSARGNVGGVETQLKKALGDPNVNVIFAAGIIASARAQALSAEERAKPIIAGAIEFSNFNNEGVSKTGTSTIPNFTFVLAPRRIPADLAELARLSGSSKIHTLIDHKVIAALTDVASEVQELESRLGIDIELIPAGSTAADCAASVLESTEAVYLPILPALPQRERDKLLIALRERKIPTLSMQGHADVEKGALAGLSPDNRTALFRRMALNIHQVLSGIPTTLLPVVLSSNDRLVINMETARKIGWSPGYDTVLSAELLHMDLVVGAAGELTLEDAMAMAAKQSADKREAKARLLASYWETQSLRTSFNPQVGITGQGIVQGIADRIDPMANPNTGSFAFGAEVSQLLYSDRLTSQIRAQKEIEEATALDLESVRLDAIETAGLAFIDCLLTDALFRIEKDNLALSQQNLNLAQTRSDIGAADLSEVFRWQASVAQVKTELIQSDSDRKNARVALNVAIAEPRTKPWIYEDIELANDEYYFMSDTLRLLLTNLEKFRRYQNFVKEQSVARAPELRAFEKNLAAQGILLTERGRRNFRPELNVSGSVKRVVSEIAPRDFEDQSEWSVGIGFTIPLFEGRLRKTESERLKAVTSQLNAQRDKALYLIEQRALASVYGSSASHPTLRLSRLAIVAAQKNYDSVQSKYSLGSATVLDLLDAQNQLVSLRKAEAAALYQYLKDVVSIQRSMAWFEFSKTDAEKAAWTEELRKYLQPK